ncbi:MAG: response regulator transcription factor [Anaerolineae bacterium]|nr:response regulator transcription factor [Anaerolineae bacterium]
MIEQITVLIVDDHTIVRQGVRGYLEAQPDITIAGEAASGEEAVRLAADHVPDVVLMDLVMPGPATGSAPAVDGVEATRRVRRASPRSQVVVLTSYHEDAHIFSAIKAGALSYLLKDVAPEELAAAVRAAARGEAVIHPRVAARIVQELRGARSETPNPFTELTDREMEVMRLIAEGASNAEIAERLILSEKTVKGYVSNILSKLHLADRTQAAVYAWREGVVRR